MARSRLSLTAPIGCSQASNRHARRTRMVVWCPDPPRSPGIRHDRAEVAFGICERERFRRRLVACVVDPERGRSGHRRVTLHHVSWRKTTRQHRSPTFGDIGAGRLVPIRRARPVSTGELSVNGHGHTTSLHGSRTRSKSQSPRSPSRVCGTSVSTAHRLARS